MPIPRVDLVTGRSVILLPDLSSSAVASTVTSIPGAKTTGGLYLLTEEETSRAKGLYLWDGAILHMVAGGMVDLDVETFEPPLEASAIVPTVAGAFYNLTMTEDTTVQLPADLPEGMGFRMELINADTYDVTFYADGGVIYWEDNFTVMPTFTGPCELEFRRFSTASWTARIVANNIHP